VGSRKVGYLYFPGGRRDQKPTVLLPHEVAHFAPLPDPTASFRGMSWLTPVVRELMGDTAYTRHKVAFIENAATPNLAVSLKESVTPEQFDEFVETMNAGHKGPVNAGKTLYLGGGADVTVVGANMKDLDFKAVQGAGETRLAAASGVGAVIAQFSEGMQGSSLNAGNYAASRRRFADITMRHLWQEASVALEAVVTPPVNAHLWYDARDIPFLQEDAADAASIRMTNSAAVRSLIEAGFEPDAATEYMQTDDIARLLGRHTGKTSVQLQEPGAAGMAPAPD
jgi:phage portal protein BeeE